MKRRIIYGVGLSLAIAIVAFCGALLLPPSGEVAAQQDLGWKVWVKTSPCSGRFDWVTVAKENPTYGGGGGFWQNADLIMTGTGMSCVRVTDQSCTKAQATAEAATVRGSSKFSNYCCREYSVWQHVETKKMSIVVGKFGTAGLGWNKVRGDLCCEEAEAYSGLSGACSGNQGGSAGFGPMTETNLQGTTLTFYRGTTPEKCQTDCGANPQCKAFSLIKAGAFTPGTPPMCYLISAVTVSGPSSCCISAVKNIGGGDKPTSRDDLSGNWVSTLTHKEGCSSRWDLVLKSSGASEWQGTVVITQLNCAVTEEGRRVSNPMPVRFVAGAGGRAKIHYVGHAYDAAYTANQIVWNGMTYTRK